MKRKALIRIYMLTLCMVLIITGCAKNSKNNIEYEKNFEQMISDRFTVAEEVYSWFTGYGEIEMDHDDKIEFELEYHVGYYARVIQNDISTMEELSDYLHQYFEDSLCNELLNYSVEKDLPLFKEYDGVLYCFAGYVGLLSYDDGDKVISIDDSKQEDSITVHVHYTVTIFEELRELDLYYTIEKGDDGIWRFDSNFVLPIEAAANL
ncbi:MAG: hypothetical protein VB095_04045 [Anaerovorax sp.]|nr:hypothetical protein [Anaerovorax sp.]